MGIYELYDQVRWSAFLGLATLVLFFPVAAILTGKQIKYQELCAGETDKRIVLVNEFVLGIRVLKYLGWERSFLKVMDAQREKEVGYLRSFVYLMSLTFAALLLVPLVMSVVVFASYAGRGQDMTPAVVFTTISLINVIRWPFTMLPMALGALGQAIVALNRIEKFLQTPEIEEESRQPLGRTGFEMKDAQFTWPKHKEEEKKKGDENETAKGQKQRMGARRHRQPYPSSPWRPLRLWAATRSVSHPPITPCRKWRFTPLRQQMVRLMRKVARRRTTFLLCRA